MSDRNPFKNAKKLGQTQNSGINQPVSYQTPFGTSNYASQPPPAYPNTGYMQPTTLAPPPIGPPPMGPPPMGPPPTDNQISTGQVYQPGMMQPPPINTLPTQPINMQPINPAIVPPANNMSNTNVYNSSVPFYNPSDSSSQPTYPMNNMQAPPPPMGVPDANRLPPPMGGVQQMGGMQQGGMQQGGMQQANMANQYIKRVSVDPELAPDPRFMDITVGKFVNTNQLNQKQCIPLAVTLRPLAEQDDECEIPIVNFGTIQIARCRSCRAYISPYDQFVENGRRWKCSICATFNDVPTQYYSALGPDGKRVDINSHPELLRGQVEFVATAEYMMRPPQAPVYIFLVDVSYAGVENKSIEAVAATILNIIQSESSFPGQLRTQFALITYDSTLHFYHLKKGMKAPEMIICSDLEDQDFIPLPDDLLVNLSECKDIIISLLKNLAESFAGTRTAESCLGSALQAAFNIAQNIGGKILVFQSMIPNKGLGALKNRDTPQFLGTDKEKQLLQTAEPFYAKLSDMYQKKHLCCDLFLFCNQHMDVSSLIDMSKNTGGQLFYYPGFFFPVDGTKLYFDLYHDITRETGWEGVLRTRVSKGLRISGWYGNCAVRTPDLIGLPNIHSDSVFTLELEVDGDTSFTTGAVTVQSGLLYTTSEGNRRIRCHTISIELSSVLTEAFDSINIECLCNLLSKRALSQTVTLGMDMARLKLQQACVEIIRSYRSSVGAYNFAGGNQFNLPPSLQLLPLYIMSMQKSIPLRGGNEIHPDERMAYINCCSNLSIDESRLFYYPNLYRLDTMEGYMGLTLPETLDVPEGLELCGSDYILLPPPQSLSAANLAADGIFLLDDALNLFIWIGSQADPTLVEYLLGIQSIAGVDTRRLLLQQLDNEFNQKVNNIINAIREVRSIYQKTYFIAENSPFDVVFRYRMVEDRASFPGGSLSYPEYINSIMQSSGPSHMMTGYK